MLYGKELHGKYFNFSVCYIIVILRAVDNFRVSCMQLDAVEIDKLSYLFYLIMTDESVRSTHLVDDIYNQISLIRSKKVG